MCAEMSSVVIPPYMRFLQKGENPFRMAKRQKVFRYERLVVKHVQMYTLGI